MRKILGSLSRDCGYSQSSPQEVNEIVIVYKIREWLIISGSHKELAISIMFTHSSNIYFLNTYCVPCAILDSKTKPTLPNEKQLRIPALGLIFWWKYI